MKPKIIYNNASLRPLVPKTSASTALHPVKFYVMSRYRKQNSYNHRIKKVSHDFYAISWVIDRYYTGSRLRFPTTYKRYTDEEGAKRFAKKWDVGFDFSEGEIDNQTSLQTGS